MLRFSVLIACTYLSAGLAIGQQNLAPNIVDARKSAEAWLALVDSGKYGESYDTAAAAFKSATTRENWIAAAKGVRDETGAVKSRKLREATYTESLPNAPSGKYVVIQYDSELTAGSAIETVVPMLESDGSWKVSGYFVRPKP